MAQTALPAPQHVTARRRIFFGLFDTDGWSWALVKSLFWFVLIILMLGYIPDRAYYFTVQRTVDLGILAWSPVNLCPAENGGLPCPAPAGATLAWESSPAELNLPATRTHGAAGIIGQTILFAGGSDGATSVADTYVTHVNRGDNLNAWTAGPALPEARSDAAGVVLGNSLYVIGGFGPDGQPTSTVYSLTVSNDGTIGDWVAEDALALPEPRAGAAAVTVSDGLVLLGGTATADAAGATRSVWKVQQDTSGKFGAWVAQSPLFEENVDGFATHVGDVIHLVGGRKADGSVVATVQQGLVGGERATAEDPNAIIAFWRASELTNLPGPRSDLSGFTANGAIYVQGGSDGVGPRTETLWATPDADGVIPEWHHLAATDLGEGLEGAAAFASGSHAFTIGGTTSGGPTAGLARVNLAPQEPFFQLGLLGAVVPALQLEGEIGQQIGYLNAAGAATANFVVLLLVGWGFAHKDRVRAFIASRRRGRG
jgi:hypothetical protein